jgi:hypothetical protein
MTLEIILVLASGATTPLVALQLQSAEAFMDLTLSEVNHQSNCCCIWSNIYVAWWTNNTENNNEEGMFRASNDAGQTFGPVLTLPTNGAIGNTEEGEKEERTLETAKVVELLL